MRQWVFLLGGLLVWTAHFFGLYIAASLFPRGDLAAWLTILLTVAGLAAIFVLARSALRQWRNREADDVAHWASGFALLGYALAGVAILYQGLPALLI